MQTCISLSRLFGFDFVNVMFAQCPEKPISGAAEM